MPIVFGMANRMDNCTIASTNTTPNFISTRSCMNAPKTIVRRSFNSNMPATFGAGAGAADAAAGVISAWSFKADIAATIAGTNNAALQTLGASCPNGSYITSFHEPENDDAFIGANEGQWIDFFQALYSGLKAGNPNIHVGYIAMAYHWWPGRNVTDPDLWWPGAAFTDYLMVDTYNSDYLFNGDLHPITDLQGHMRWHNWAVTKNKPLGIAEYGIEKIPEAQRPDSACAQIIRDDIDWMVAQNYFACWYWNDPLTQAGNDFSISDRPLSTEAWRDKSNQYGRAVTDPRL